MSEEKVYAYKVTIKETVGDISKTTILETDNLDLTVDVLGLEDLATVDSDLPNRNITKEWEDLVKKVEERKESPIRPDPHPFGSPYNEGFPWKTDTGGKYPWDNFPEVYPGSQPFIVTC